MTCQTYLKYISSLCAVSLLSIPPARGQEMVKVLSFLDTPVAMTSWPGTSDVLLVCERGTAKVVKYLLPPNPSLPPLVITFLDLSAKAAIPTSPIGDFFGVTGFAFHPQFLTDPNKRLVYVRYNRKNTLESVIEQYEVPLGWDLADPNSAEDMFTAPMSAAVHSSGQIHFDTTPGSENRLYWAVGDDFAPSQAGGQGACGCETTACQDDLSVLGKLLVFDVDGSTPWVPSLLAKGLRNPHAFSVDRGDGAGVGRGDVWIGTSGGVTTGDILKWPAGTTSVLNFGWPWVEGDWAAIPHVIDWKPANCNTDPNCGEPSPAPPYTKPFGIYWDDLGQPPFQDALIGGYVYRGTITSLQGDYIFTTFGTTGTPTVSRTDAGTPNSLIFSMNAQLKIGTDWSFPTNSMHGMGEDWAGELYVIRVTGTGLLSNGTLFKIVQ